MAAVAAVAAAAAAVKVAAAAAKAVAAAVKAAVKAAPAAVKAARVAVVVPRQTHRRRCPHRHRDGKTLARLYRGRWAFCRLQLHLEKLAFMRHWVRSIGTTASNGLARPLSQALGRWSHLRAVPCGPPALCLQPTRMDLQAQRDHPPCCSSCRLDTSSYQTIRHTDPAASV